VDAVVGARDSRDLAHSPSAGAAIQQPADRTPGSLIEKTATPDAPSEDFTGFGAHAAAGQAPPCWRNDAGCGTAAAR